MIWVVKYIQEYDLIMTWCNSCLSINKIFTVTVALFYGTIFLRKCAHKISLREVPIDGFLISTSTRQICKTVLETDDFNRVYSYFKKGCRKSERDNPEKYCEWF